MNWRRNVYNIKDFGALGDGSDDREAFQAVLDAAGDPPPLARLWYWVTRSTPTVYIPAGTYRIGDAVLAPSKVSVRGEGTNETILT